MPEHIAAHSEVCSLPLALAAPAGPRLLDRRRVRDGAGTAAHLGASGWRRWREAGRSDKREEGANSSIRALKA